MPVVKLASNRVENRRKFAAILTKILVTHLILAKKRSRAKAQKQEMKCGASKAGEGNGGKTLPCTEECARLERNRKLALALNIDQSTHVEGGDHIPFSTETLNLFAAHPKWGQTQEREFRVFATSDDEKRLRFKPMKANERAFIHSLATDFGFDSESMDPEPHRHVMIWKTPRFVTAPGKTLAEALRIRQAQRSLNASANVSDNEGGTKKVKASNEVGEPYNSFVISSPRFGLTVDELRNELVALIHPGMTLTFDVDFLPSEEVLLKAVDATSPPHELQQTLQNIKAALVTAISAKGFGIAQLCTTDPSLNILRRESDSSSGDGWSRVAAKKAAPKFMVSSGEARGSNNSFAALTGSKVTFTAKKKPQPKVKPKKEVIVDDWEAAELAEEEKERGVSGSSGEDDGGAKSEAHGVAVPADGGNGEARAPHEGGSTVDTVADATAVIEQQGEPSLSGEQQGEIHVTEGQQDWASQVEAEERAE